MPRVAQSSSHNHHVNYLNKCFDTIDHELLIKKMGKYGGSQGWFENYFSECTQAVAPDLSGLCNINSEVPQGVVLSWVILTVASDGNLYGLCNIKSGVPQVSVLSLVTFCQSIALIMFINNYATIWLSCAKSSLIR